MAPGDREQQFQQIYQTYIDEVYGYVYARIGFDVPVAEDITQEIFLDVFKSLGHFKGLCSERTWIYKITKSRLADYYRLHYKDNLRTSDFSPEEISQIYDPNQDIDILIESRFQMECIKECLNRLPEHYKLSLVLKYIDEKSVKEIAQIAGKSVKATESILQRAKITFIKEYQKR